MNKIFVLAIFLCICFASQISAMRKQGVAVQGKFLCGISPAAGNSTKVRITDIDTGPDPDDTLDEKFVDASGSFKLNGFTRELTPIDPVLYVWTECNDGDTPCMRKIKFVIPKKFTIYEEPPKAEEWFDIGVINLHSVFENEKRECIS